MLYFTYEVFHHLANQIHGHIHVMLESAFYSEGQHCYYSSNLMLCKYKISSAQRGF